MLKGALLLFLGAIITPELANSLECYSCQSVDNIVCNITTRCSQNEVCFVTKQGNAFTSGCTNGQHCSGSPGSVTGTLIGRDVSDDQHSSLQMAITSRQTNDCYECCSVDRCNANLCVHSAPSACVDDETVDCARMNSLFSICSDIHKAKLVCSRFCNLCSIVDGQWSTWSSWSQCPVTCENGTVSRSRTCTNPAPAGGGLVCPGASTETKTCKLEPCPVDGGWSDWSQWGSCSVSCDVGMQFRDRSCSNPHPARFGNHCFGVNREYKICNPGACADGNWSDWGAWSSCSDSCGGGLKTRERTCTNPSPSLLGRFCSGSSVQILICNNIACNDGGWSNWETWSACSESCGGALKSRERTCTNPLPSVHGRYCSGSPVQAMICNKKTCPDRRVAFTAFGEASGFLTELIFPQIIENFGNDYNGTNGRFTCTIPGIYYFSTSVSKNKDWDADYVVCTININSKSQIGSFQDPISNDRDGYSLSISGTFHLNVNDVVSIGNCVGQETLNQGLHSSFTGFLIMPDD